MAVLFVVEFFGDKVPAFDLIWNALHTFVRVPVAALIAYLATSQLSPGEQALCALAGGVIALGRAWRENGGANCGDGFA